MGPRVEQGGNAVRKTDRYSPVEWRHFSMVQFKIRLFSDGYGVGWPTPTTQEQFLESFWRLADKLKTLRPVSRITDVNGVPCVPYSPKFDRQYVNGKTGHPSPGMTTAYAGEEVDLIHLRSKLPERHIILPFTQTNRPLTISAIQRAINAGEACEVKVYEIETAEEVAGVAKYEGGASVPASATGKIIEKKPYKGCFSVGDQSNEIRIDTEFCSGVYSGGRFGDIWIMTHMPTALTALRAFYRDTSFYKAEMGIIKEIGQTDRRKLPKFERQLATGRLESARRRLSQGLEEFTDTLNILVSPRFPRRSNGKK